MKNLKLKYQNEYNKVIMMTDDPKSFKKNIIPLSRVRNIIKEDPDVEFISNDTPILFSKACELIIMDIVSRAEFYVKINNNKVLKKKNLIQAIRSCNTYDFLIDILPDSIN